MMNATPATDQASDRRQTRETAPRTAHETRLRVRYAETDRMGVTYYANYLVWFEVARSELMRGSGVPYTRLEEEGFFLRVSEVACRLLAPAHYDEEISVLTWLGEVKSRKVVFRYEVRRDGALLATGHTVHIPTDQSGKVTALTRDLRRTLDGSA